MIATIINAIAIIIGSVLGLIIHKGMNEKYEKAIFTAAGITSLIIGISMSLETKYILILAFSLMLGGIVGTFIGIEDKIYHLGEILKKTFARKDTSSNFAFGFLNASILFCAGAMAIVGSFNAGTKGDYSLILTKSVLDGFVAVLLTSAYGAGVMFSAASVLLYQGMLTILSVYITPYVSEAMLFEITSSGGALVIMIAINLLKIGKIKTGDFLPAMVFAAVIVFLLPFFQTLMKMFGV